MFETTVQQFSFPHSSISLVIPNNNSIQQWYSIQQQTNKNFPFPYWAKVWPSAIALANFLQSNKQLIYQKKVLELAAGLGLPSLVAAKFAATIVCSDYVLDPLNIVEQSMVLNKLNNVKCSILDWNDLPEDLSADVLLLSDINYEPTAFNQLLQVVELFLQNNSTIILATPQRIMAKPFIEAVLPFCIERSEMMVDETAITILVLKRNF